ncbi:hypothetical protein, partial [Eggerthella sp. BIOML-A1]|uniref:hypothetical protein n=1 Tax=Eggerthella sp. BIOML-A1 TaxID=2584638 RepID=UPI0019623F5E
LAAVCKAWINGSAPLMVKSAILYLTYIENSHAVGMFWVIHNVKRLTVYQKTVNLLLTVSNPHNRCGFF